MRAWNAKPRTRWRPGTVRFAPRPLRPRRSLVSATLEGVPFFVPKSSINKTLVKQVPKTVVLCDWEGDTYSKLGFPKGATIAVAVFEANGTRLGLVTGELNDERMAEVLALLPE